MNSTLKKQLARLLVAGALLGGVVPFVPGSSPVALAAELSAGDRAAQLALSLVGTPYRYGGSDPSTGLSSSGLVRYVWGQQNVTLPSTMSGLASTGTAVSKADLRPGDILVFTGSTSSPGQFGVYAGNGSFVTATSSSGVLTRSISNSYYVSHWYGARRVSAPSTVQPTGMLVEALTSLRVRSGPGTEYATIASLTKGQRVELLADGRWRKVRLADGQVGYVSGLEQYSRLVSADTTDTNSNVTDRQAKVDALLATARSLLGSPYVRGAEWETDRAFDCSSFTQYVFAQHGITLPRTEDEQAKLGTWVSRSQLQPGDLVFFKSDLSSTNVTHAGIYIGDGKIIDAANASRGVAESSLSWSWYDDSYYTARRIIP